jgi:hypothetical protein
MTHPTIHRCCGQCSPAISSTSSIASFTASSTASSSSSSDGTGGGGGLSLALADFRALLARQGCPLVRAERPTLPYLLTLLLIKTLCWEARTEGACGKTPRDQPNTGVCIVHNGELEARSFHVQTEGVQRLNVFNYKCLGSNDATKYIIQYGPNYKSNLKGNSNYLLPVEIELRCPQYDGKRYVRYVRQS